MVQHLLNQFSVKVHGNPELACDHCYVYQGKDGQDQAQLRRGQPVSMSDQTVSRLAERIADYAAGHGLDRVVVVLRGGEPLLMGPSGLRWIFRTIRAALQGVAEVELSVQTSGVYLDERFAELFLATEVPVTISRPARKSSGQNQSDRVARAVRLLGSPDYRPVFAGLRSTVDLAHDPVRVFQDLAVLDPPAIDLVLPPASWEHPPPGAALGRTPYGDWLVRLFDHWYAAPPLVGIRLFEEVMHALLGGVSQGQAGLSASEWIAIGPDGSLRQTDSPPSGEVEDATIESLGQGANEHSIFAHGNIFAHSMDDVLRAAVRRRSAGTDQPPAGQVACRACSIISASGGGHYPHRYQPDTGVDQPSVYCPDLTRLISHLRDRIITDLSDANADVHGAISAGRGKAPILHQGGNNVADLVDIR